MPAAEGSAPPPPTPDDYRPFQQQGWRGSIHRDFALPPDADPLAFLREGDCSIERQRPTATTWRVRRAELDAYVKHMTGAKDTARPSLAARAKWELRPSRALWILRTGLAMERRGIHTPPVLLAARRRAAGGAHDLLVTRTVPGQTLGERMVTRDPATRRRDLERIAETIAAMHRAGVHHGDLLPGNILVTPGDAFVFLDNDRTVCWPMTLPLRQRRRNLAQMVYRFVGAIPHPDAERFLAAYFAADGAAEATRRRESARIWRRVRRRFDRAYGVAPGSRRDLLVRALGPAAAAPLEFW